MPFASKVKHLENRFTYLIIIADKQNGFGYDILQAGKVIIHQPNMPGLLGNKGFNTKEDAEKVAELVIHKLINNIMPPSVNKNELDSLQIKF